MQIACSHCSATYMFDAALIPAQGYDARCTSCQGVFFVHPDGANKQPQKKHETLDEGDKSAQSFAPQALHRGTLELDDKALSPVAARRPAPAPASPPRRPAAIDDDLDLGPRFGRGRHPASQDNDAMMPRQPWARRGLFLGVALVAVIGSGVVVGVVCSKRLHAPPSVQPPIHIVRAPDPIAAEAFSRGMKALWVDTGAGYTAAAKAFDAACARDPEFTDAWAGAALAALLQSADIEAQAQAAMLAAQSQAQQALLEVARGAQGFSAQNSNDGDDDTAGAANASDSAGTEGAARAQMLRLHKSQAALIQQSQQQAESLHQQAHALQRRGASLLLHGDHLMTQTPLMSLALAMWYTADGASLPLARQQLRAFEQLVGGDCMPMEADPNNCVDSNPVTQAPQASGLSAKMSEVPYGPLAFWIEARLIAQPNKAAEFDKTVAAYEKALALQPDLRRARWELAQYQWRAGRTEVAQPLLEDLAHGMPPHDKSQRDLQKLVSAQHRATGTAP